MAGLNEKIGELKQRLLEIDVLLTVELSEVLHDREIRIVNGWTIKIGRGLDFYQKSDRWFAIGANDFSLRKCLETKIDIFWWFRRWGSVSVPSDLRDGIQVDAPFGQQRDQRPPPAVRGRGYGPTADSCTAAESAKKERPLRSGPPYC